MPLDRRITIRIASIGEYVLGTYQPGPDTDYEVWAERRSTGSADVSTTSGVQTSAVATWTVRWFTELVEATISLVSIIDEFQHEWNAESVSEAGGRRRALSVQAIRTVID